MSLLARRVTGTFHQHVRFFSATNFSSQSQVNETSGSTGKLSPVSRSWKDQTQSSTPKQSSTLKASSFLRTMEERKTAEAVLMQDRNVIDKSFVPNFQTNATYDPFDFSMAKLRLDRSKARRLVKRDQFAERKVNPLSLWKDDQALSDFITSNGRILPGHITGLKGKTQKRLAKAIRRCRAAGLLSTVHQSVAYLPDEQHPKIMRSSGSN